MTRVLVVAPTRARRARLRRQLETDGVRVIAEAAALSAAAAASARADVIVVAGETLVLPVAASATALAGRAVVAVIDDERPVRALLARSLRGWAIVPPGAPAAALRAAVTAAARGLVVLSPALAGRFLGGGGEPVDGGPPGEPLTPREREVLELLGQGLSNRRIAERLGISEHTAKFHVASVCGKLGAASRTEAVSRGIRRGLVTV